MFLRGMCVETAGAIVDKDFLVHWAADSEGTYLSQGIISHNLCCSWVWVYVSLHVVLKPCILTGNRPEICRVAATKPLNIHSLDSRFSW